MIVLKIFFPLLLLPLDTGSLPLLNHCSSLPSPPSCAALLRSASSALLPPSRPLQPSSPAREAPSITSPLPKASRARLPWLGLRGRWHRVAQGPPGVLKARTRLAMLIWLIYENQIWLIYENRYKLTISTTQSSPVMFDEEYRK